MVAHTHTHTHTYTHTGGGSDVVENVSLSLPAVLEDVALQMGLYILMGKVDSLMETNDEVKRITSSLSISDYSLIQVRNEELRMLSDVIKLFKQLIEISKNQTHYQAFQQVEFERLKNITHTNTHTHTHTHAYTN
eukprot:GHVR01156824.1.p1 GENE.GHVR01156824.1~~GHVR01156824.1.p1  ORF type:complete len:135 (-),score=84.48 GHVR01156824.1:70-474(-)